MSFATIAVYVCQALAAWLARRAARLRPAHRPVAFFLALYAVADPIRAVLAALILHPAREALGPGIPYSGFARAVFSFDQGLFLVGPLGLAIVAVIVFFGQRAPRLGHLLGLSALLLAALVVSYPSEPGAAYEVWRVLWWPRAIAGVHVAEQLVAWGAAVWWLRKNPGGWTDETSKIVMALACADLALWLAGVLPGHVFVGWHLGDAARAAILAWVCWVQIAWIRSVGPAAE